MALKWSLLETTDQQLAINLDYFWHHYVYGVPCGPTLAMIPSRPVSVREWVFLQLHRELQDKIDLEIIGISLKDHLIAKGYVIPDIPLPGVVVGEWEDV